MHGKGELRHKDKKVIKGNWMQDQLQGPATIVYSNGKEEKVRYRNG